MAGELIKEFVDHPIAPWLAPMAPWIQWILYWKMAIEIVDLPIENGDFP
jgi:hypothetical protein